MHSVILIITLHYITISNVSNTYIFIYSFDIIILILIAIPAHNVLDGFYSYFHKNNLIFAKLFKIFKNTLNKFLKNKV